MKYSQKLIEILKIKEIRQEDLARELGVTFAALNRWINEKAEPRVENKNKIDNLYNVITGNSKINSVELDKLKYEIIKDCTSINIGKLLGREDFLKSLIIKTTYTSNKIEGSTMTESEVSEVLYENVTFSHRSMLEHTEAKNHEAAIYHVLDNYKENISVDYILKLSLIMMNGIKTDAGMFRNHNVRIAGSYVPTANHLSIRNRIDEFIKYTKTDHKDKIKFLAEMHARFEAIHPFSDGNGRVGRLLLIHFALKYNQMPVIILPESRGEYLKALQKAQLDSDYDNLIKVIIDSIRNSFEFI